MPLTLDQLVRTPALGLTVLAGEPSLRREIRWVHTSELADPTPYLEGGELLLTTGMKLGRGAAERRDYVDRLADAGVVGLGLGIGLTYARVPPVVVEAAERRELPLFTVPRPTPFIAISKMVSSALAADQYEAVATGFAAQQELTRAVLGRDGTTALVRRLAARMRGWAALYDASGVLVHVAPAEVRARAAALADDITRLRAMPAPASASLQGPGTSGERVVLQSLGADRRVRGFLAVGTDRPPGPADRQILGSAVSLLTLALEQSRALGRAEGRLHTAVLRLLLTGERRDGASLAAAVAGDLGGGLPEDPLRVVVATGPEEARAAFADRVVAALAPGRGRAIAGDLDGALVLAVPSGGAHDGTGVLVTALRDLTGVTVGVSGPAPAPDAARAYHEALGAHEIGRRAGQTLTVHGAGAAGLLPLLDDEAVRAWSAGLLAPLREHDAAGRGDLVASLRAWLARHGQWDAAAHDLGVHRHTLRYRMRRAEELLGRRLDDPDVRAELWLALRGSP